MKMPHRPAVAFLIVEIAGALVGWTYLSAAARVIASGAGSKEFIHMAAGLGILSGIVCALPFAAIIALCFRPSTMD
jgi:hypothetical protein